MGASSEMVLVLGLPVLAGAILAFLFWSRLEHHRLRGRALPFEEFFRGLLIAGLATGVTLILILQTGKPVDYGPVFIGLTFASISVVTAGFFAGSIIWFAYRAVHIWWHGGSIRELAVVLE